MSTLAEKGESIQNFIERLGELEQAMQNVSYNRNIPYVLTTVHSSKGLEYDNVIIMDEISPVFPDSRSNIEEERRLFYVAMTRAKNNLILLSYDNEKRPFIDEIEEACTPGGSKTPAGKPRKPVKKKFGNPSQYVIGAHVVHDKYGTGQIINVIGDVATVRFDRYGEKKYSITVCADRGIFKFV